MPSHLDIERAKHTHRSQPTQRRTTASSPPSENLTAATTKLLCGVAAANISSGRQRRAGALRGAASTARRCAPRPLRPSAPTIPTPPPQPEVAASRRTRRERMRRTTGRGADVHAGLVNTNPEGAAVLAGHAGSDIAEIACQHPSAAQAAVGTGGSRSPGTRRALPPMGPTRSPTPMGVPSCCAQRRRCPPILRAANSPTRISGVTTQLRGCSAPRPTRTTAHWSESGLAGSRGTPSRTGWSRRPPSAASRALGGTAR